MHTYNSIYMCPIVSENEPYDNLSNQDSQISLSIHESKQTLGHIFPSFYIRRVNNEN